MPEVDCELYKLIEVTGSDAVEFLQGQLTQDVTRLEGAGRLLSAWCNPKGRVIVVLRLVRLDNGAGLLVPATMADRLLKRLEMYRLRAEVEFHISEEDCTALLDGAEADPAGLVAAGIPTIDDTNSEEFTPHMLNLDRLGAISFTKGCYTGQEVVARTEHLGKSKRRMMRYEADSDGVRVGDKVSDGERNVGEVLNVAGRTLLAVTPLELHGQELAVGAIRITPTGLPYDL